MLPVQEREDTLVLEVYSLVESANNSVLGKQSVIELGLLATQDCPR